MVYLRNIQNTFILFSNQFLCIMQQEPQRSSIITFPKSETKTRTGTKKTRNSTLSLRFQPENIHPRFCFLLAVDGIRSRQYRVSFLLYGSFYDRSCWKNSRSGIAFKLFSIEFLYRNSAGCGESWWLDGNFSAIANVYLTRSFFSI